MTKETALKNLSIPAKLQTVNSKLISIFCFSLFACTSVQAQVTYGLEFGGEGPCLYADVYGPLELSTLIYGVPSDIYYHGGLVTNLETVNVYAKGTTLNGPVNWGSYYADSSLNTGGTAELTINSNLSSLAVVQANDQSTMNIESKTVDNSWLFAEGQSKFNIYGGSLFGIDGISDFAPLSGQPTPDSTINVYGGSIYGSIYVWDKDTLNLFGGNVASITSYNDGTVNLYGNGLYVLELPNSDHYLNPYIFGTLLDGTVLNGLPYTGSLADLHFYSAAVPEPASILLIGLGGLAILRKPRYTA